ncbi:MAG: response regulator, partial [Thermoanaerobaculia bacterium]
MKVVEDVVENPHILFLTNGSPWVLVASRTLTDAGLKVELVPEDDDLLSTLESQRPDLLLVDADSSARDGFDACKAVRQGSSGENTPILLVTERRNTKKAFAAGATDIVISPPDPAILIHRSRALVAAGRALREARKSRESLEQLAHFDGLTELPNRVMFR